MQGLDSKPSTQPPEMVVGDEDDDDDVLGIMASGFSDHARPWIKTEDLSLRNGLC